MQTQTDSAPPGLRAQLDRIREQHGDEEQSRFPDHHWLAELQGKITSLEAQLTEAGQNLEG